jgi:hypothetical protein
MVYCSKLTGVVDLFHLVEFTLPVRKLCVFVSRWKI